MVLADHIIVEDLAHLGRRRHTVVRLNKFGFMLFANYVHTQLDAFITDEYRRAGDKLAHLVLAFSAERAVESVLGVAAAGLVHVLSTQATLI